MNGRKTEIIVGCRIDKHIHVRFRARFIAGMRTEQIESCNAEGPQGGFGLFSAGQ